ncbi:amidohydrolase [Sphingomonas sp.]|uniref:amidohydrolase n=1 Tax=Sphingomonas sp. TaxID=28214 RepID=UPI0017E73B57|nr:amidohydrolase [Sphingomonas sp.]MBA3510319.1 amidohydrolase family protein [Sphingomonas sp.]
MLRTILALNAALLATPALADTLIHNANGIQVGADGKLQRFESLLIGDDGKVIRTFSKVRSPAHSGPRIDAQGRTLLPGLIDAHGHVMGLGLAALRLDLTGTGSLAELQSRLQDYAAANPDGWIVGRGWNQELWADKRFPTAADLDSVVPGRPVALERVDGHALVVNRAALKQAGITAATRDPVGGRIERDQAGHPTGLLIDAAMALVESRIPAPSAADRERALAKAQDLLLATGLTAVADMGTSAEDWVAMNSAAQSGRLQLRIMGYAAGVDAMPATPSAWLHGDHLRMVGVKLYADGALGSRGAWLKRPYADKPDTRGLRFLTDAELRAQANRAAAAGFQLAIHAIGDAANAQVISTYEALRKTYAGDRRWRIEHVQVVDRADIPRIGRARIIASMQPVHQTSDRTMAEARLDPPRLAGAYAWNSIAKSGGILAFGSDFPVESPNPFPGLAAAVSRQDPNGIPPGGWRPEERVSLEQALAGFTRNAAFAGFAEDRIGSLEPGKWADFILVDRDPTRVNPQELAATEVFETWVAGKKVWQRSASAGAGERGK